MPCLPCSFSCLDLSVLAPSFFFSLQPMLSAACSLCCAELEGQSLANKELANAGRDSWKRRVDPPALPLSPRSRGGGGGGGGVPSAPAVDYGMGIRGQAANIAADFLSGAGGGGFEASVATASSPG